MPIGIATVLFLAIAQIKNLEVFDSFAHAGQGPAPEPPRFFRHGARCSNDFTISGRSIIMHPLGETDRGSAEMQPREG